MRISNSGSRSSATEYAYSTSKSGWTLAGTATGSKSVYVWFKNDSGLWSGPKSDSIIYDRAPVGISDYRGDYGSSLCNTPVNWTIPGHAATDADGNNTLTIVKAWAGSVLYPHTNTVVNIGPANPTARTYYLFSVEVTDPYGRTAVGSVSWWLGPC